MAVCSRTAAFQNGQHASTRAIPAETMVQVLQVMRRRHRHRDLRILSRAVRMQADRAAKDGASLPTARDAAASVAAERRTQKSTVTKPRPRSRFDTLSHPLMVDSPMMHGLFAGGDPDAAADEDVVDEGVVESDEGVEDEGDEGTTADGDTELDSFDGSGASRRKL